MTTDYTKFADKPEDVKPVVTIPTIPEITPDITPEPPIVNNTKNGIVTDCVRLNVREQPNARANIVCVIDASTELVIDPAESTEDFYKICTVAGVEGFCMKRYITIMP